MKKAIILFLYAVALYVILKKYYQSNSGLPKPSVLATPSYLYGILALSADFLEGFPIVIAAAATVALIWQANATQPAQTKQAQTQQKKASGNVG